MKEYKGNSLIKAKGYEEEIFFFLYSLEENMKLGVYGYVLNLSERKV